jgi:dimethylamine/trimethylamine dehydrogenase
MRGYDVTLAEAGTILGGRVARERLLPGLAAWGRVADYRQYQISQRTNVETYFDSRLTAEDVLGFGFQHVAIATGSHWRRDGVARQHVVAMPIDPAMTLWTPDDIMARVHPENLAGKTVLVYDDDHYYMGGVMAEVMAKAGAKVILVTPSAYVSDWTRNTLEQGAIHVRLDEHGVDIRLNRGVTAIRADNVETNCTYTGRRSMVECDAVLMVASRISEDGLYRDLIARKDDWADAGIRSVKIIGDAEAPAPIAWATYAGHRYARELDMPDIGDDLPFRREITQLEPA